MTVPSDALRSEEHTSELKSHSEIVCRLLLEKKKSRKNGRESLTILGLGIADPYHYYQYMKLKLVARVIASDGITRPIPDRPIFNTNTATTEIYTLSLHDALPISTRST